MPFTVATTSVPILHDPPFLAVYALLGAAAGRMALRVLGVRPESASRLERGVVAATVGLGLLQFVPFALGSIGLLTPTNLWLAHGVLAAVLARDGVEMLRSARRVHIVLPRGWMLALAGLLCVALGVTFLYGLGPVTDPDGLAYHMTAPKRWLQRGSLAYLPTLVHTNAPMGVEMLITSALGMWSDTAAKAITWVLGALMVVTAYSLGRRLGGSAAGVVAASLTVLGVHKLAVFALLGMAYIDLGVVGQVLGALLALTLWRRTGSPGWLGTAALCAGLAGSYKLTAITVGGAVATLAALYPPEEGDRSASRRLGWFAKALVIAALPVAPWLWRTWVVTGNPVWPVFASVFPTRDMTVEGAARFADYFRYENWGTVSATAWSREVRVVVRAGVMVAAALAACVAAWRVRRADVRVLVVAAFALLMAAVLNTGLYMRFLLPVYALLVVALAAAVTPLLVRRPSLGWALVLLAAANLGLGMRRAFPPFVDVAAASAGVLPREVFLRRHMPLAVVCDRANSVLPPDALVLSGAGGGLYYMDAMTVVLWPNNQWLRSDTWDNLVSDLQLRGVGYVIVGAGDAGYPHQPLVERYGIPMGPSIGGAQLYRLVWQDSERPEMPRRGAVNAPGSQAQPAQPPRRLWEP